MTNFTESELDHLQQGERRLGRIATVGSDGTPHVAPVGYAYNAAHDSIDIGGINLTETKKYRDAERTGRAAIVVDDVLPPWHPRGVEVRGRAEVIGGADAVIRIHPERIVSWGLESDELGKRHARDVTERG